jgi:hypothetical protein
MIGSRIAAYQLNEADMNPAMGLHIALVMGSNYKTQATFHQNLIG